MRGSLNQGFKVLEPARERPWRLQPLGLKSINRQFGDSPGNAAVVESTSLFPKGDIVFLGVAYLKSSIGQPSFFFEGGEQQPNGSDAW